MSLNRKQASAMRQINFYKKFTTNHTNRIGTGDQGLGTRVFVWKNSVKSSRIIIVDNPYSQFPIPHSLQWFVVKIIRREDND